MDTSDRVDAYLSGEMSAEEEKAFEQELLSNKALREEVEPFFLLAEVMSEERIRQDEVFIAETRRNLRRRHRILRLSEWSVAIAAVWFLAFYFPMARFQRTAQNAFTDYYSLQDVQVQRGGDGDAENVLNSYFDYVGKAKGKDVEQAIRYLRDAYSDNPSDTVSWYLALAYIKDRQIDAARPLLERIAPDSSFGAQAKELLDRLNSQNFFVKWGKWLDELF